MFDHTQRILGFVSLIALFALFATNLPALADGPGEFKFDDDSFQVVEEAGVAVILVERSSGEDGAVTVQYETSDVTALAGSDYTSTSGTLSWSNGDDSDRVFQIPILDDDDAEGSETLQLRLFNPTGGATLDDERRT